MLFVYGITTANTPVTGLQTLLLTAGSTMIIAGRIFNIENIPFAPVFLTSYLITQANQVLLQT
ncbi:hypothetical protein [Halopenitus persicus]|uniref:hypothetical protein n=1 Tax=Halopenitus persicus TaxID=1048396 RepID=UPI0012FD7734|nr:hypothetical protein [Halopenitus persicus]